jgi:hypothetical protein
MLYVDMEGNLEVFTAVEEHLICRKGMKVWNGLPVLSAEKKRGAGALAAPAFI